MTNISKRPVDEKLMRSFFDKLASVVVRISSHKSGRSFLYEILTPTERIMFVKRFAIVVLLSRGVSWSAIESTIKVSPATIERVARHIDRGVYNFLVKIAKDPSVSSELIRLLEKILPPQGKRRWKFLYDL